MRRALAIVIGLLVLVGSPLADARGKPAAPPGQQKDHPGQGHADAIGPGPAPVPTPDPAPSAPAPTPAASPSPAPKSTPARHEPARILAFDMGGIPLPSLPPYQTAGLASVPVATTRAPLSPSLPAWTWILPAVGLVSAGATLLVVRKGRAPAVAAAPMDSPILRIASANVPSLLRAGKAALDQGRTEEAIAWFTQATKLDPRLPVAHFSRGVCLASADRHEEAYRALKKAHDLDRMEGAYRLELARAGARTGRGGEAMTLLASLIAVLPELADDVAGDEAFASLLDHPRFLMMVGKL